MKKYMVYYINSEGYREGNEYMYAYSREEARELYMRFFNVSIYDRVQVVPVYEREVGIEGL